MAGSITASPSRLLIDCNRSTSTFVPIRSAYADIRSHTFRNRQPREFPGFPVRFTHDFTFEQGVIGRYPHLGETGR